jgi:hypothetical protein
VRTTKSLQVTEYDDGYPGQDTDWRTVTAGDGKQFVIVTAGSDVLDNEGKSMDAPPVSKWNLDVGGTENNRLDPLQATEWSDIEWIRLGSEFPNAVAMASYSSDTAHGNLVFEATASNPVKVLYGADGDEWSLMAYESEVVYSFDIPEVDSDA